MFRIRLITSLVGVPLLLIILYQGGWYWKGLFFLLASVGLFEFYRMLVKQGHKPLKIPGYSLLFFLLLAAAYPFSIMPGIYIWLTLTLLYFILSYPRFTPLDLAGTLLGSAYIGFLLSYAIRIADLPQAFLIILLAFLLTWASDIGGYLFGSIWGKSKMSPLLSPGKSWEGSAGALLMSVLVSLVFFVIFYDQGPPGIRWAVLLGLITSILAQCGDLFISAVKRYAAVKDTGKVIPGHGGVLDRFDAFLLVVPVVYYFFYFWG